ncbi:MAG: hypothetical protein P8P80_00905 [Crocinitomicaceae bacterium]|nr:hypothetical protein [Crocinitomicaceae bacterium]
MNAFEALFWSLGASWQFSVLYPFVVLIFSGFIAVYFLSSKISSIGLRLFLTFLLGLLPAVIYFVFYPIYESDVGNNPRIVLLEQGKAVTISTFEVITLPNCPYCVESIDAIVQLKKRNPDLDVIYKILSSSNNGGHVAALLKKSKIKYAFVRHNSDLKKITKGSFPTFAFRQKGRSDVFVWNNNTFGSCALDFIEAN